MNEPEYSSLRSRLKSSPGQPIPPILLTLLDWIQAYTKEDPIEGETVEEFTIRIRDTSAETAQSLTKYLDNPFNFGDKYDAAMELYRAKELNKALLEINDAIFAAMAHPTIDDIPHFGEFEESEVGVQYTHKYEFAIGFFKILFTQDDDDSGDSVEGSQSNGEEQRLPMAKAVHISRIYFDLKWRQVETTVQSAQ